MLKYGTQFTPLECHIRAVFNLYLLWKYSPNDKKIEFMFDIGLRELLDSYDPETVVDTIYKLADGMKEELTAEGEFENYEVIYQILRILGNSIKAAIKADAALNSIMAQLKG